MKYQRGLALFTTMVLLVITTLASVVLVRNASFETKVSGAYAEQATALGEVNGAVDQIIFQARGSGENPFLLDASNFLDSDGEPIDYLFKPKVTGYSSVQHIINFRSESQGSCGRSFNANSQNLNLSCRFMALDSTLTYSRSSAGETSLETGIAHPLL